MGGAILRVGADPVRLHQLAIMADLFSRIPLTARRDLALSLVAMVALGDEAGDAAGLDLAGFDLDEGLADADAQSPSPRQRLM
jgi:hypothetical protein